MNDIQNNPELVAYCGLYCAGCMGYLKGKCPGCRKNEKASWCGIRTCCMDRKISTCAECREFQNPMDCRKYNNFITKVVGFIFRSNRAACIAQIKELGLAGFAEKMSRLGLRTLPR